MKGLSIPHHEEMKYESNPRLREFRFLILFVPSSQTAHNADSHGSNGIVTGNIVHATQLMVLKLIRSNCWKGPFFNRQNRAPYNRNALNKVCIILTSHFRCHRYHWLPGQFRRGRQFPRPHPRRPHHPRRHRRRLRPRPLLDEGRHQRQARPQGTDFEILITTSTL